MKQYVLLALLLLLGIASAKAQVGEKNIKRFPCIQLKELELKDSYLVQDPAAFLKNLKQKGINSRSLPVENRAKVDMQSKKNIATKMPIMEPDSTIKFQILAVVPDSATLYHMPVKKPD